MTTEKNFLRRHHQGQAITTNALGGALTRARRALSNMEWWAQRRPAVQTGAHRYCTTEYQRDGLLNAAHALEVAARDIVTGLCERVLEAHTELEDMFRGPIYWGCCNEPSRDAHDDDCPIERLLRTGEEGV